MRDIFFYFAGDRRGFRDDFLGLNGLAFDGRAGEALNCLGVDEDAALLLTGDAGGCVKVWDMAGLPAFLDERAAASQASSVRSTASTTRSHTPAAGASVSVREWCPHRCGPLTGD